MNFDPSSVDRLYAALIRVFEILFVIVGVSFIVAVVGTLAQGGP